MSRLSWDGIGDKIFEGGVDRGVFYPENSFGVAWNGLVNVIEKPTLSTSTSYYQDGQKYLDKKGSEEFAGSIEAFTFPDEFAECDGTWSTEYGFELTQQTRKPFNLCYRTGIGNDIAGLDHGYKLHLIYDAVASPSNKAFPTLSSNIDVRPFLLLVHVTIRSPRLQGHSLRFAILCQMLLRLVRLFQHLSYLLLISQYGR